MRLPLDKVRHVAVGAGAAVFMIVLFYILRWPDGPEFGAAGAVAAGAFKEGADWLSRRRSIALCVKPTHSVDPLDFAATVLGGLAVLAVAQAMG